MAKTRVCSTADVPEDGLKAFEAGGEQVLIVNSGDKYYAYQALCPHQEAELEEGFFDGCTLTCHEHLWQWDVRTGEPQGLAEKGLASYELTVEDGEIYVDI